MSVSTGFWTKDSRNSLITEESPGQFLILCAKKELQYPYPLIIYENKNCII